MRVCFAAAVRGLVCLATVPPNWIALHTATPLRPFQDIPGYSTSVWRTPRHRLGRESSVPPCACSRTLPTWPTRLLANPRPPAAPGLGPHSRHPAGRRQLCPAPANERLGRSGTLPITRQAEHEERKDMQTIRNSGDGAFDRGPRLAGHAWFGFLRRATGLATNPPSLLVRRESHPHSTLPGYACIFGSIQAGRGRGAT